MENKCSVYEDKLTKKSSEISILLSKIQNLEKDIEDLKRLNENAEKEGGELAAELANARALIVQHEHSIEELNIELTNLKSEMQSMKQ